MKDEIKEILEDKKVIIDQHWNYIIIGNEKYYDLPKRLLDYITNLQIIEQQYSAVLSENAELENKITNLQEIAEEHKKCTRKYWQNKCAEHCVNEMLYKSRIDKAVEYIENDLKSFLYSIEYKTLLNILNGDK